LAGTSFAHILFATGAPGKPRPVGGELHNVWIAKSCVTIFSYYLFKMGIEKDLFIRVLDKERNGATS
jgi:hypothetical protein